jgi:ferredoxin--NADP+ reductase
MNLVRPTAPVVGRVVSNQLCMRGKSASFVKHLEIDVANTPLAGTFRAGQSFGVIPPGTDENGKPHKLRLYSVACPTAGEDGSGNVLSTTPKRLIDEYQLQKPGDESYEHRLFLGVCSNYLCDLRPGDDVQLSGPNGKRFLLPEDPALHDYLFIATGTGIAPFRGMVLELLEGRTGPTNSRIDLVMGTPYTTDLLYDSLFEELAGRHENFHYHTAISREPRANGAPGLYVDALIEEQIAHFAPLLEGPRTLVYLCGLAGMQIGLLRNLAARNLHHGYVTVGENLEAIPPAEWTAEQVKRFVKPTPRCMLEVY